MKTKTKYISWNIKKTKINTKKQLNIIKHELFINKPQKSPYSKDVIKRRELLLFAQVFLANYDNAINKEEKLKSKIAYLKTMNTYFNWH
ncbi:MAG: hypothetical protein N2114_06415 [Candidatus Goldbacteria bacterium]|nr:hypothetical protein [Candidatus Goldiibacteriota bacterium]